MVNECCCGSDIVRLTSIYTNLVPYCKREKEKIVGQVVREVQYLAWQRYAMQKVVGGGGEQTKPVGWGKRLKLIPLACSSSMTALSSLLSKIAASMRMNLNLK